MKRVQTLLVRRSAEDSVADVICLCVGTSNGIFLDAKEARKVIAALRRRVSELSTTKQVAQR